VHQLLTGGVAKLRSKIIQNAWTGEWTISSGPISCFLSARSRIWRTGVIIRRAKQVRKEITWIEKRTDEMMRLHFLRASGRIPERITHNDTKINNVLFDTEGRALCVSDLDTVMPGIVHYDFGDAVRTAASTAAEDEENLNRVSVDLGLFEAFSTGYLHETASISIKWKSRNSLFPPE